MIVGEPFESSLLGPERPLLPKLAVHLLEDEPGTLDVTLTIPLDPNEPDERAAIEQFAPEDRTLDVRYLARINLAAEREELSRRFAETYRKHPIRKHLTAPELGQVPDELLRDAFTPIAAQGHSVFQRLFEPPDERGALLSHGEDDDPLVRRALASALARPHRVVLKSPLSLFPWAMLYDDARIDENDLSTFDARRFWGFRHVLQEEIPGAAMAVRLPQAPRVVAAVCPEVDAADEHRQGPLGKLAEARPDGVSWLGSAEALRRELANFDGDCLYFYGHAVQADPPTPTTSYLRLDGINLTAYAIRKDGGPNFKRRPVLAFLNGCETKPLHVWDESSIAGLLCLRGGGRVCAVTTFAEVPVAFGRRFGQLFWERFLGGDNVGVSLQRARAAMLEQYQNPLGLLYALLGRAETRLG
ncbi:CHAT domain-containing protein [Polyangium aurulentum]|uniref:CHAT domain-containing protein n=1 Tax=Polyangium aurulentum TaxID=2567896 RepID=UPI0010AE9E5C|nr:CHAT domain-containing protein [Polyangium aurulentum]UQA57091.1 CHAT domain-containing protein [Polyangium aurulentum]